LQDSKKQEAEFAEEKRVLADQFAQLQIQNQDLSARLAAETAAKKRLQAANVVALLRSNVRENRLKKAHAAKLAESEREIAAEVQRRLAAMRSDLERERAEIQARQEELIATAAARAKASSPSVGALMTKALELLSGVLAPEQVADLNTKFRTKGFDDFKREILDPVSILSAKKSERVEFF